MMHEYGLQCKYTASQTTSRIVFIHCSWHTGSDMMNKQQRARALETSCLREYVGGIDERQQAGQIYSALFFNS